MVCRWRTPMTSLDAVQIRPACWGTGATAEAATPVPLHWPMPVDDRRGSRSRELGKTHHAHQGAVAFGVLLEQQAHGRVIGRPRSARAAAVKRRDLRQPFCPGPTIRPTRARYVDLADTPQSRGAVGCLMQAQAGATCVRGCLPENERVGFPVCGSDCPTPDRTQECHFGLSQRLGIEKDPFAPQRLCQAPRNVARRFSSANGVRHDRVQRIQPLIPNVSAASEFAHQPIRCTPKRKVVRSEICIRERESHAGSRTAAGPSQARGVNL